MQPLFTGRDLQLIEALVYRPELRPSYEHIKDCLVWEDERAERLSRAGYESLSDLWIARSFIHRGLSFSAHTLDPNYFADVWDRALAQGLRWPGFQRLSLNEVDRAYYDRMRADRRPI